jgi:hypothetical protein
MLKLPDHSGQGRAVVVKFAFDEAALPASRPMISRLADLAATGGALVGKSGRSIRVAPAIGPPRS